MMIHYTLYYVQNTLQRYVILYDTRQALQRFYRYHIPTTATANFCH